MEKKMKRVILISVSVVMVMSLSGCIFYVNTADNCKKAALPEKKALSTNAELSAVQKISDDNTKASMYSLMAERKNISDSEREELVNAISANIADENLRTTILQKVIANHNESIAAETKPAPYKPCASGKKAEPKKSSEDANKPAEPNQPAKVKRSCSN
jgi:uncharacterized protein YpmB